MSESSVVAGIDIAKAHVDVAVNTAPPLTERFANDRDGHATLSARATSRASCVLPVPGSPLIRKRPAERDGGVDRKREFAGRYIAVRPGEPRRSRGFQLALAVVALAASCLRSASTISECPLGSTLR